MTDEKLLADVKSALIRSLPYVQDWRDGGNDEGREDALIIARVLYAVDDAIQASRAAARAAV